MGQSLSLPCIPSPEEIADLSAAAEDVVVVYDGRTMEEDEGPAAALSSPLCTAEMAAADSESTEGLDTRAWDIASLLEAGVPRERCAGVLELSLRGAFSLRICISSAVTPGASVHHSSNTSPR